MARNATQKKIIKHANMQRMPRAILYQEWAGGRVFYLSTVTELDNESRRFDQSLGSQMQ